MTETLPDEAGTMPGLGPVPLLQRQSASNSRWTRTVPMASAALFVFGAILAHLVLQQALRRTLNQLLERSPSKVLQ